MKKKPNILFIITDHFAYFSQTRQEGYKLNMDCFHKFQEEGVSFERAYSVSPICTPARASMMTGLYPSKHGLRWNTENQSIENRRDFRQGQELYSHYLARAGYRNAYVGKWHCGHDKIPHDYGMEGWSLPDYGKVYMSDAYKKYAKERGFGDARAYVEHCTDNPEFEGETLVLHNPSPWYFMGCSGVMQGPPDAHEQQFVANMTIEKLKELAESEQPWSLVSSFWGPHEPYFPSEPFASMVRPEDIPEYPSFRDDLKGRPFRYNIHRDIICRNTKRWDWKEWQEIMARCYAQALQTDAAIGKVLNALKELGMEEDTIVIWTSDHGDAAGSHGGLWDKHSTYIEEVARIPLAIRWPGVIPQGGHAKQFVNNMDLTATILEAAGISVPESFDSRSLLPLCKNPDTDEWPEYVICEHHGHSEDTMFPQRIVVCRNYKYVACCFDGDELYDLEKDPYEMKNLIDVPEYAQTIREMRELLIRHIEESGDEIASRLAFKLNQLVSE